MSKKKSDFKSKYKIILNDAIVTFRDSNKKALNSNAQEYIYQVIATIGLEIESKFPSLVAENGDFKLFGRIKSPKSLSTKKQLFIDNFKKDLKTSLQSDSSDYPTQIRQLYDFYGFKFVAKNLSDTAIDQVMERVLIDILNDINKDCPNDFTEIHSIAQNFSGRANRREKIIELIDKKFNKKYPGLKEKFYDVYRHKKQSEKIKRFVEETSSLDISTITESDYYQKIIDCYSILSDLAYEESTEEIQVLQDKKNKVASKLAKLETDGKSQSLLSPDKHEKYSKRLKKLLTQIESKRTNKLDLSVNSLIIFDVLSTSEPLKRLGVKCSKDLSRTKQKRMPNGYISDFYSLDLQHGLKTELQVQSEYRFEYGERGPAAHNRMENNIKKRIFIKRPKKANQYHSWKKKQFNSLPQYFQYQGNGHIYICSALDNFKKYYYCKNRRTVQKYVDYITKHEGTESLDSDFRHFSLDSPPVLDNIDNPSHDER